MNKNLILNLKKEYFEEIKLGIKIVEYRLYNSYWEKRLLNKNFNEVIIKLGYPKKNDLSRQLNFKWNGYVIRSIKHKEFGEQPVKVFCIFLNKN